MYVHNVPSPCSALLVSADTLWLCMLSCLHLDGGRGWLLLAVWHRRYYLDVAQGDVRAAMRLFEADSVWESQALASGWRPQSTQLQPQQSQLQPPSLPLQPQHLTAAGPVPTNCTSGYMSSAAAGTRAGACCSSSACGGPPPGSRGQRQRRRRCWPLW